MVALKKLFLCLFFGYSCLVPVHASTVSDDIFPLYRVTRGWDTLQQVWASGSLTPEELEQRREEDPGTFHSVYIPHCIEIDGQWQVEDERVGYYPKHRLSKVPLKDFAGNPERWGNPKMADKQITTRADLAQRHPREFSMVLIPDLKVKKGKRGRQMKEVPMNALLNEGISFYLKGYYRVNEETEGAPWKRFFYDNSLSFDTHRRLMINLLRPVVLTKWGQTKSIANEAKQVIFSPESPLYEPLILIKDGKHLYCLEASGRVSKRILPWKPLSEAIIYDLGANVKWAKEQPEEKIPIIYWDAKQERVAARQLADWPIEVSVTITWQQQNSVLNFPTREFSSKQLVREVKKALANQVKTANGEKYPSFAVAKQRLYIGGANGVLLDDNATLEFYSKGGATLDLYLVLEPETKQNEEEEKTPQQATNPSATREKKRWVVLPSLSLLGSGGLLAWYSRKKAEAKEKATEKQKSKKKKNINKKGREKGEATVRARSSLT